MLVKCAMEPNREFDPDTKKCKECCDFDFCYLEWINMNPYEDERLVKQK